MNSKSDLAFSVFNSKWVQAMLRRDGGLGKRIFSTATSIGVTSRENGILIPHATLAIFYEVKRVERVIESISRALFYLESGCQEKWTSECVVKSPKLLNRDLSNTQDAFSLSQINQAFIHGEKRQELGMTRHGVHPEVFYYQFLRSQQMNFIIRMVFYNDFAFFAFPKHKEAAPASCDLAL
ncbi:MULTISPECIES: hypothetical protein [unclassified Cyanobium]|uniref:hypothetical protein n=1 Tax=unclassified Cyanobium TaxID=2627006 RepID=UPI0020CC730D|nr:MULTISPECIES: hypothetical protein [unclassified Cyanobium]MCP9835847.1 hypothetical protein [Cyanobium sp. La Preciosa 7G6]MCP9938597.1 hypothetical protein [Cyanobium sp. Aljojuca 7A6]